MTEMDMSISPPGAETVIRPLVLDAMTVYPGDPALASVGIDVR